MTNIEVFNLSANDPSLLTQNVKQQSQDGIVKYGENDDQFDYLLEMYVKSTTNNAIINAISLLIYANGLNVEGIIKPDDLRKVVKDFKLFGNFALQIVNGAIMHVPVNYIRAQEVNEDGKIENYFYSTDWKDSNITPEMLPSWELQPTAKHSIYYGKPYTPNAFYYNLPNYQGALGYCELEIEISKFLLKTVKKSFSVTKIINFNNGVPQDESQRKQQVAQIKRQLTGAEGDPIIVAFNEDKEHAAEIQDVTVDNAADQYTYVSEEAQNKIIVGHQVTSPLLLGIRTANGFSSNSDEMTQAAEIMNTMQIIPAQEFIIDALEKVSGKTGLEFVTNLTDEDGQEITGEGDKEASYNGAQIASALSVMENVKLGVLSEDQAIAFLIQMLQFDPDVANGMFEGTASKEITELRTHKTELQKFIDLGTDGLDGFDLFSESEVDLDLEDELDAILLEEFREEKTLLSKAFDFVGTGKANPKRDSSQDSEIYAVRYKYSGNTDADTRPFCSSMIKASKIYRKEDIALMENRAVNPGWGVKGANTYSIWLHHGGARCHHKWLRQVYLKSGTGDKRKANLTKKVSVAEARRKGFRPEANDPKVGTMTNIHKHKGYVTKSTMPEDARKQTGGF